jgi:hypothetical protein
MGKQYVCLTMTWETWKRFDKLASEKNIKTERLIDYALLYFLSKNEAEIETKTLKHKIESDLEKFCRTLNSARKMAL